MRRSIVFLVPAVAGMVLVAGCGGGFVDVSALPGEEGATRVAETYLAALAEGDGARACSLADRPMQQALIAQNAGNGNCLDAVTTVSATLTGTQKAELAGAAVDHVNVTEGRGSVQVRLSGSLSDLTGLQNGVLNIYLDQGHWVVTQQTS